LLEHRFRFRLDVRAVEVEADSVDINRLLVRQLLLHAALLFGGLEGDLDGLAAVSVFAKPCIEKDGIGWLIKDVVAVVVFVVEIAPGMEHRQLDRLMVKENGESQVLRFNPLKVALIHWNSAPWRDRWRQVLLHGCGNEGVDVGCDLKFRGFS